MTKSTIEDMIKAGGLDVREVKQRESNIPIPILTGNATPRIAALIDAERTMECYRELARAAIDWVLADRKADDAMAAAQELRTATATVLIDSTHPRVTSQEHEALMKLQAMQASAREASEREERLHEALLEQCRRLVGRLER